MKESKESLLSNKIAQFIFKLITALSFLAFTVYQTYLAINIENNRTGRLIGIVVYLLISIASFLDISQKYNVWVAHIIIMVVGLLTLFIMRLLNAGAVFEAVDPSYSPSVMYCTVYVLSQIGTLFIIVGYLMFRADLSQKRMQILMIVIMTATILMYAVAFILEAILLIKYRLIVDISVRYTLLSRLLFFVGFAGRAFCIMLPAPKREKKSQEGHFLYSDADKEEIDLII